MEVEGLCLGLFELSLGRALQRSPATVEENVVVRKFSMARRLTSLTYKKHNL